MKKKCLPLFLSIIMLPVLLAGRETIDFNRGWKFRYGDIDSSVIAAGMDERDWSAVNLPHDFQIHQPWVTPAADETADMSNSVANVKSRLSSRGFKEMGKGWYRKSFVPDASWTGRRVLLDFGGIMLVGDVYLNGERVGGTDYGYLGFEIDLTGKLRYGEENVVDVVADTGKPENSRWYTGGGLFRDVKFIITDKNQYFDRHPLYITTPQVSEDSASVVVMAQVTSKLRDIKKLPMRLCITSPQGDTIVVRNIDIPFSRRQKTREYMIDSLTITAPQLWSCESPSLYTVHLTLFNPDGSVADKVEDTFGIRSIEYSPDFGFKLNGKKVLLKGIANHHTLGALGAAAFERAMEKRIVMLKDFGFNHVRTSHNPYSESFLDLCDRYGILVVNELYDKWLTQYAGGRNEWVNQWQKDVPEFIRRDRNHPSVVMWSLGNELQTLWDIPYADWGVTPYRLQRELLHRYDTTRPVTVAMHPRGRHQTTDSLPAPLVMETDIASYNYRYMYFPGDSRRFPWMIFYQSEANTSNMGPNYFDMDLDRVTGLAYWGMIDYLGESHGWPAKGWSEGVFDISLEPKPLAYFLRSIFKPDEPVVHIGVVEGKEDAVWNDVNVGTLRLSDHWNRENNTDVTLYTFTNADEVELRVNGKSLGRKVNNRAVSKERNRILWENVPYRAGNIEAVAYNAGVSVARHKVETTGTHVAIKAIPDNQSWKADGCDLQHIRITAIDKKGRIVPGVAESLTFSVEGEAEIAGVINGDINSNEPTTGNRRSLYDGKATLILRSTCNPGKVTVTITPEKMKPITVKLSTLLVANDMDFL